MTATKKDEKTGAPSNEAPKEGQQSTALQKSTVTPSARFTEMVMRQFAGVAGVVPELTGYQKRLIQNYFISTDMSLKAAEEKRIKKSENKRDAVSVTWDHVNLEDLAMDVVAYSKVGLDPALSNHLSIIPYKNNKTGKYDIGLLEGYRGKELKARKYGFEVPNNVIVEVVYANDKFKPLKKDAAHDVESYEFSVSENAFERGNIVGGFYYHEYYDEPRKNKLMFYPLAEIEKRKPEYASAEFWGGEKDKWENGQVVGKQKVEGWFVEMVWKTLFRMAYNIIPIDGEKIDDNLMRIITHEKGIEALKEQDPTMALQDKRDIQVAQGTGSKVLQAENVQFEDGKKTVVTDVSFEEVKGLGGNGQEQPAAGNLFPGKEPGF